jgi:serine phosphatase RsbU (regulator of sigma subunit)
MRSVRIVMARMTDVLWHADAVGEVTGITFCRATSTSGQGQLDESEVRHVEQLWRRSVRCAERFSAVYHVRSQGSPSPRTFLMQALPVLDGRDEVLYWSGSAGEVDHLDEISQFISEAASVLSSSLNRATVVNRLIQVSVDHFCDLCAIHALDAHGSMHVEGVADRRLERDIDHDVLAAAVEEVVRGRQPLLLLTAALRDPTDEKMQRVLSASKARSLIIVPVVIGTTCIGAISFLESERPASFAAHDVDIAIVVARQLAMALKNIETFEREQQLTQRFQFIARASERLFTTLDPTKLLELLLEALGNGFADYGVAVRSSEGRIRIVASVGTNAPLRDNAEREVMAALRDRRPLLAGTIPRVRQAPRFSGGPLLERSQPQSWMMVPLFIGDTIYGAIICCANSHRYDAGDLEVLQEIGHRASLALEHAESSARERRLIQTLQQATLPPRLARIDGASLSATYRAAASEVQVGGDWYDAFDLDDHRILLTVGDVMGHGLEASSIMGKLRHGINVVAMYENDPARILDAVERFLSHRYAGSVATAFVAVFDARNRSLRYANAGHPYPILRRTDGSLEELEADGLPIGLRSEAPAVKARTEHLDDALLLAFYTDGLTEATRDISSGERLLREALGSDAIFYVQNPAQYLEGFCLRDQPSDDVAILLLNFVKSRRWTFDTGDRRAMNRARREFLAELAASAVPTADLKAAQLIFRELVANTERGRGTLDVALDWQDGAAVLHVIGREEMHDRESWLREVQRLGGQVHLEILPGGLGTHASATLPVRTSQPRA